MHIQLRLDIVKGMVASYAASVAGNHNVNNKQLAVLLREIAYKLED